MSSLSRSIPALAWLRVYDRRWPRSDVLAGVTLAAYLLPAALGDASLANLRPEAGLYGCLFGGLIFWIFCGSRYTTVSVTSAIALVIGSSLGEITGGNTMRFGALAAGTALLVHASSRPHVALLGRIPGTRRFSDRDRHPDNELIPNVMIFRPESGLVYFNVDNVTDAIIRRIRAEATPPKLVVLDLSAAARVDMQSTHTLAGMADELIAEHIQFHAVEARSSVRDRLRREGVDGKFGGVNRFATVAEVIDHFLGDSEPSAAAIKSSP